MDSNKNGKWQKGGLYSSLDLLRNTRLFYPECRKNFAFFRFAVGLVDILEMRKYREYNQRDTAKDIKNIERAYKKFFKELEAIRKKKQKL